MSQVEFEFEHNGDTYVVHGAAGWEGFVEPQIVPDPGCPKCHGEGVVKVGYEPPDEWNATGEDIYDGCDCEKEVPGSGRPGYPTFEAEEIEGPDEEYLADEEVVEFVAEAGAKALALAADDYLSACQG